MVKYLLGAVCLLVVAVPIIGFIMRRVDDRRFRRWELGNSVQAVCLRCQGRGWTTETVRTLDFDGTGFANTETPAVPCQACHGTGTVNR